MIAFKKTPLFNEKICSQIELGINKQNKKKIWCFGPTQSPLNCLTNLNENINFEEEVVKSFEEGFSFATKRGVLCEEMVRGVQFNILDFNLNNKIIHPG